MAKTEMHKKYYLLLIFAFIISACTSYQALAPVSDIGVTRQGHYLVCQVQPGETLYSIAWQYERDYLVLATLNNLRPPYNIYPGETIRIADLAHKITKPYIEKQPLQPRSQTRAHTVYDAKAKTVTSQPVRNWQWPAQGRIAKKFSFDNKGIDIAGKYGEPIRAAAGGEVVYAGNGIRGYGDLLIIKHNSEYLTAYAYNKQLLVREGQFVKQGQKIALMGMNNSGNVLLHFEIRHRGKPINPVYYL